MKAQIIENKDGTLAGVFVPIEDWNILKQRFPELEETSEDIPQWQKDILETRMRDLNNPEKLRPIEELMDFLDEKI